MNDYLRERPRCGLEKNERSGGFLSRLMPERDKTVQSIGNISNSHLFGVNCVYQLTLNGSDPYTAKALIQLSNEYHALRFAIDRLITIIEQKGGAL